MELRAKNKKLVLYCTFLERDFPRDLKGRWSGSLKGWVFSPSIISYNSIVEKSAKEKIDIFIDEKVSNFFNKKKESLDVYNLNQKFKTKPYKYQEKITSLIVHNKKCFVFAGVGTGKSKSAIDAVTVLWSQGEIKKVLVVSPASIMWNFGNEIELHSDFDYTILHGGLEKRKKLIEDSNTVFDIINYEILHKIEPQIKDKGYDAIIFDEVHYCKNRTSSRSKSAYRLSKNIERRIGLTGTIISNSYEDLFQPYKIIDESIFGNTYSGFRQRYFVMGGFQQYEIIGYKNEKEIKKLVATNSIKFNIRDVIDNLPEEKNIIKKIRLSDKSMRLYKELKNNMIIEHERGDIIASNVLERLIRLSQITSGYLVDKENSLITDIGNEKTEYLKGLLSEITDKTAIFCRFRRSIDRVVEVCESLGLSYYVFDGRTKEKDLYLKFNTDDTQIWIAQIQKSEGYSIPSARYCIFYELDYSRKNHVQSRGRILRASGSKHDCIFYIYLIASGTIDEIVYETLKNKNFTSQNALELVKGVN